MSPTASTPDGRSLGDAGEEVAASFLADCGYRLLARQWRLRRGELRGELDLVAVKDGVMAFVEVKTRRGDGYGGPLAAVTDAKQAKIRALASAFLRSCQVRPTRVRFDVITVRLRSGHRPDVRHLRDAF